MADFDHFPSTLNDGELCIPSDDIFPNEVVCPHHYHYHHQQQHQHGFSCFDVNDIAHRFTALSLLQQAHNQTAPEPLVKRPSNLERLKQPVRSGLVNPLLLPEHYFVNGGVELRHRLYASESDLCHFLAPTQTEVDRYLETARAMVSQQRQRQQQLQNRFLQQQNQVLPFQGRNSTTSGFGYRESGFVRESGGTGVFHPRIIVNATTRSTTSTEECRRKQTGAAGVRSRQEHQAAQRKSSMTRGSVEKQKDCYYHLPPEMDLPRDWTY